MNRSLLIVVVALPTFSQQFPDAAALERLSSNLLKTHSSVQYILESVSETTGMGPPITSTVTAIHRSISPGKQRIETTSGGSSSLLISNGETMWTYHPAVKQYTRQAAPPATLAEQLKAIGVDSPDALWDSVKVVRSDVVEVDGQTRDCWVEEIRTLPGLPANIFKDFLLTICVDKEYGLPLRTELSTTLAIVPGKTKSVTTLRDIKFDEPLAASLFEFTPPQDAKELIVPKVNMAEVSKQLAAINPEPAHVDVPPGKPQAFVPSLRALNIVFPEYPAEPLPASVVSVRLLVTVDTAGQVADAEALTGNPAFRKDAVDAAKRVRFRPVLRLGVPVYAYTQYSVSFIGATQGEFKSEPLNMAEEQDAARRINLLQRRFPRSPAQVLEDLEQDVSGATERNRGYALRDLAKAALRAGSYGKASRYADEMLASNGGPPFSEDFVYDGHFVRGTVALRLGNLEQAKQDLLDSASTKGSPVLSSFGPNMTLAKELLEKGERETVLEFLSRCKTFWKSGQAKLDQWSDTVRRGGTPNFGANLNY